MKRLHSISCVSRGGKELRILGMGEGGKGLGFYALLIITRMGQKWMVVPNQDGERCRMR